MRRHGARGFQDREARENLDIEQPRFAVARGRNTDGVDLIDCQRVRLANCAINSGDDAIVLKSFSPNGVCRDITITNCVVSSNASGIKIGTESAGAFEDIVVQNCTVFDARGEGLAVLTVDGARIERVSFANISLRNIKGDAILVRLGARDRTYRTGATVKKGRLKDVMFSKSKALAFPSWATPSRACRDNIENVVLRDLNLEFTGGGTAEAAARAVPENPKGYPGVGLFGKLPAYGFFIRHAKNVVFENIRQTRICRGRPLAEGVACDDVDGLAVSRLNVRVLPGIEPLRLVNTRHVDLAQPASSARR